MRQPSQTAIAIAIALTNDRGLDLDDDRWGTGLAVLCHENPPHPAPQTDAAAEWDGDDDDEWSAYLDLKRQRSFGQVSEDTWMIR
jgi:hypothetical protein